MATAKIKTAVIISDLHCGSTVGLLPPDFSTEEGNEIRQNPLQKWLWECWIYAHEYKTKLLGIAQANTNIENYKYLVLNDLNGLLDWKIRR